MNKTYFVVSDIHSYLTPLKTALFKAGFRKTNKDHILIVCGDVFDRGTETIGVYQFLSSLPKSRVVLIRGNHDYLLMDVLKKDFPERHDFSNGTVRTCCQIAGVSEDVLTTFYYYRHVAQTNDISLDTYFRGTWKRIRDTVLKSALYKWFTSDQWKNFYEVDRFIFVHSFIPLHNTKNISIYGNSNYKDYLVPFKDWRTKATTEEWIEASWGCPFEQFKQGLFNEELKENKCLVCGHWTAYDFFGAFNRVPPTDYSTMYFDDNLIALDACTARTNKINVLVIKANTCYASCEDADELKPAQIVRRNDYVTI